MTLDINAIALDKGLNNVELRGTLSILSTTQTVRFHGRMEIIPEAPSQPSLPAAEPEAPKAAATPTPEPAPKAAPKPKKPRAQNQPKAPSSPAEQTETVQEALLAVLRLGPLTTSEAIHAFVERRHKKNVNALPDEEKKRLYNSTHANLTNYMRAGLVKRIEENSIDKWALVGYSGAK